MATRLDIRRSDRTVVRHSPIRGLLGDADLDERAVVAGRGGEPPLELRHSRRLDDEVVGAGLERLGVADLVVVAGHHDDVHRGPEHGLELADDVEAIGPGHLQIDD
ncbi:MAG TPA: hypothetical protein VHT91_03560, partial [Kofleriaceae bacterium]|nr:hypothetical protein [Kofleriaceae bacterium]